MSDRKYRIVSLHECEIQVDEVYEPDEDWLRDMDPLPDDPVDAIDSE